MSLLLVMLGIQTLRYLSRVSVLALKISRYIVFITNRTFYSTCMSCLKLELSFIILVFSYGFLFIPFSFLEVCMWFCALLFQLFLLWVGWVLVFFLIRPLSRKLIETHFWQEKLFFRLSILYYKLNQVGYLTNTFHFAVGLFSYRLQMSNCGKK